MNSTVKIVMDNLSREIKHLIFWYDHYRNARLRSINRGDTKAVEIWNILIQGVDEEITALENERGAWLKSIGK